MRRYTAALLSSAMLFSLCVPAEVSAADKASGYELKFTIDNGTITITGAAGSGSDLTIPDKIDGLTVTSIADNFFADSIELTTVTLPDSIRSIGSKAFSTCQKLSSVYIGADTSKIGDYAFSACPSLRSIEVSAGNKTYRSENGSLYKDDALLLYAGEKDAEIPPSTRVIGKRAFFGKTEITSVTIPESVEIIGDYAFSGCLELKDISIPDSVTSMGNYCFLSCSSLESAKLSESMKAVPENCFSGCTALQEINLPDSVSYIGANAFYSCESLKSIYVPPTVETIGTNALGRTYSLRDGSVANVSDFRILGRKGSVAEKYASSLGMAFEESDGILLGDVDGNNIVDGRDASLTLTEYAMMSTGHDASFTDRQNKAADYNHDGIVDGTDATAILTFYAKSSVSN